MLDVIRAAKTWAALAGRDGRRQTRATTCETRHDAAGRGLAAVLSLALALPMTPAMAEDIARGEVLLTKYCASCHALGQAGPSPHPEAPAFRTLGQRYPIESLEEALAEGIMSGHPDMPEFSLTPTRSVPSSPF